VSKRSSEKNWPAKKTVKVSDDFIVKQNCLGTS